MAKNSRLRTSARPLDLPGVESLSSNEAATVNGGWHKHPHPVMGVPMKPPHPVMGVPMKPPHPVMGVPIKPHPVMGVPIHH